MITIVFLTLIISSLFFFLSFGKFANKTNESSFDTIVNSDLDKYYQYRMEKNQRNKQLLKNAAINCLGRVRKLHREIGDASKLFKQNLVSENFYQKLKNKEELLTEEKMLIECEAGLLEENYGDRIFSEVRENRGEKSKGGFESGKGILDKSAWMKRRIELNK